MKFPSAELLFAELEESSQDSCRYEKVLYQHGASGVGGVDEAGRGPLAGPVVAACVVLAPDIPTDWYKDSKVLSPARREKLYGLLLDSPSSIGVGVVEALEIEQLNIHRASLEAMKRAVTGCAGYQESAGIDFLLVDGKFTIPMPLAQHALIKGESKSASIAAASIVAKVSRDRLMRDYHQQYPQYNFIKNQGYPTREHRDALRRFGPCPIHRKTYKGVREFCVDPAALDQQPDQQTLW
ncbi:ribonuclease HII [Desulfogranum mediterraneum]|uniref:ribonuclease HII n=1 Tax=Desulfogranum mediterraneum TaxID=160661 RepID=UPI0004034B35|nr:ribonuclease HII [Desulfogranum mediterraneum]